MSFRTQFVSVPTALLVLGSTWVYLSDWVVSLLLSLAFVYYFNRLVALLVSWALRVILWKRSRVAIEMKSFKLSVLGGRILMKNVTVIHKDTTFSLLNVHITWRYWLFSLPKLSAYHYGERNGVEDELEVKEKSNKKHASKIVVDIEGFEVFMYNRTMAFDQIMELLNNNASPRSSSDFKSSYLSEFSYNESNIRLRNDPNSKFTAKTEILERTAPMESKIPPDYRESSIKYILTLLPVKFNIKKGAIVLGNASTPSIVVASYKSAAGFIDLEKSPCNLDPYRFVQDLTFETFQVRMKPNMEYDKARFLNHPTEFDLDKTNISKRYKYWNKFKSAAHKINYAYTKVVTKITHGKRKPTDTGLKDQWRGLRRYIGDQQGDPNFLDLIIADEQYAKYNLILDSASTRIVYYYDSLGKVPLGPTVCHTPSYAPPEHGVELHLSLATIHYGPWADKQRVPLQSAFFPALSRDSTPTVIKNTPGTPRQYSGFQITTIVKDEVILRVPTREPSKNKDLLKEMSDKASKPHTGAAVVDIPEQSTPAKISRPFGWLEIKLGPESTASFFTSYIAKLDTGWGNKLTALFHRPEVRTSVNHDILFIADSHTIDANLGYPLSWNGKCEWLFKQKSDNAKVFFLREHTLLFSDIFTDFGSGEPTPYEFFRPFVYMIDWEMTNYKLFLNVNDANIISNPLDFDVNKFVSFQGDELRLNLDIPLYGDFTKTTTISYNMETSFFNLVLDTPPWHTVHAFAKDSEIVGRSNNFTVVGSYTFFTNVEIQTSNHIEIRCLGEYVTLKLYGPLVKYLFLIRENYFGDHIHFKTFEEFTSEQQFANENGNTDDGDKDFEEDVDYSKILKTENDVDVLFSFLVRHGLMILPCNIYDCKTHIGLSFNSLDTDIRFTNYYMDLQADISPVSGTLVKNNLLDEMDSIYNIPKYKELFLAGETKDITIDGLSIHAHRMFGLPPEELTYYCKWDLEAGDVRINSHASFISGLGRSLESIIVGFIDLENGLHLDIPTVYDALNFSFKCGSIIIKITLETDTNVTFVIDLGSILLTYNDIANLRYSTRASLSLPAITIKILDETTVLALVETSLVFNNICQKKNMLSHRWHQQRHIKLSDEPYHRSPFLLFPENRDEVYYEGFGFFLTPLTLPDVNPPLSYRTNKAVNEDYWDSTSEESHSSMSEHEEKVTYTKYDDEDFTPAYPVDALYEYDNFIFELGETHVRACPSSLEPIANLLIESKDFSLDLLMDSLQIELVSRLKACVEQSYNVKNLRLISKLVTFQLGIFESTNQLDFISLFSKYPNMQLSLVEPSLALSLKEEMIGDKIDVTVTKEIKKALHVKEIHLDYNKNSSLVVKDFEFWLSAPQDEQAVISLNVEDIELDAHIEDIDKAVEFAIQLQEAGEAGIERFKKLSQMSTELAYAELVYKLVVASVEHSVEHDPEVLTRPVNLLRSKPDHVRFFDSWKMVTRLRHILDHLPQSWLDEQNIALNTHEWKFTDRAYTEVTENFARWRSWEANTQQREIFYNFVFSPVMERKSVKDKDVACVINLNDLQIKIINNQAYDSLRLNNYTLSITANHKKLLDYSALGLGILDNVLSLDFVSNLGTYKSKLSDITVNLVMGLLRKFDSKSTELSPKVDTADTTDELPLKTKIEKKDNYQISLVSNVASFQQHFFLPFSYFELIAVDTFNSLECSLFEGAQPFAFAHRSKAYDFSVCAHEQRLVHSIVSDFNVILASGGDLKAGSKIADITLGKLSFNIIDKNDSMISNLKEILERDVKYVNSLIPVNKNEAPTSSGSEFELGSLFEFALTIRVRELSWVLDLLHPLKLHGAVYESQLALQNVAGTILLESLVLKVDFNADVNNVALLEIQNSQLRSNLKFTPSHDLYLLSGTFGVGYAKLFSPLLLPALDALATNRLKLQSKYQALVDLYDSIETILETSPKSPTIISKSSILDKVAFKGKATIDYIGLSTFVDKAKFSFEVEDTSFGMYNVANVVHQNSAHEIVHIYGDLAIPTARLYVVDRSIPVGLSTIVDVNLTIRVLHDGPRKLQSLQVESQYCRVCLSPQALFKIVDLLDVVKLSLSKIPVCESKKLVVKEKKLSASFLNRFSAAHLLAYNFCCGWIFEDGTRDYPGIIIGAERFFAIAEETLGKFTLMEAYLSVANGARSSNYYSTQAEKKNLNRALLPRMQLVYTIDKLEDSKNVVVTIKGDELDVKFLSTSVVLLEHVAKSGLSVQKFFNQRAANLPHIEEVINMAEVPPAIFSPVFDSVEFRASFAGSTVFFNRLNDDSGELPSLLLHSPTVNIAGNYKHQKTSGKKHVIKVEVLTGSSDNTLHSTCVPVVVDFVEGMKRMVLLAKTDTKTEIQNSPSRSPGTDYDTLFKDVDIHFGLKIEKQALTLSCDPKAKVAAMVGLDGIYIQINTGTKEIPSIVLAALFDRISVSLQHVYSRQVSGSISTKSIILTSSYEFGEVPTILSSGSFVDVEGYINVKQYQDLDLFKDIWFPKQYAELYSSFVSKRDLIVEFEHKSELASNKNISAKFKEVSTSYALPWVFTLIISNIKLQVDFGPSLGDFSLTLGKVWAVSKKSTDWAQDLKLCIDSICLSSEGRLGGSLDVKNVNIHTAISWKLENGMILDVPLILLSAGVETLQAKSSFDLHVFAIAHIEGLSIDVFNQKSEVSVSKDHLFVTAKLETAEIYLTSLTASNCFDIWNTISRMIQDNKRSYKETLRDSDKGRGTSSRRATSKKEAASSQILETVKKLEAKIQVISGRLTIHVYPSSFDDSKVLVVKLDESKAYFQQNEFPSGVSNDLEIKFNDLKVSLSATSSVLADFIAQCKVSDFIDYAKKARGGTIFVFPSFKISMRTFQKYDDNVIEYLYQSSFGGTVDVRWNLGSVNFIREMHSIHTKALQSRTEYRNASTDKIHLREDMFKKETPKNLMDENANPAEIIDNAVNSTIDKVANASKYIYSPLAPPIIEAPQLKELGNATPPLEWFGLHRNKFPNVTHEMGIVSLQKLMHEVELQYSKILGKA